MTSLVQVCRTCQGEFILDYPGVGRPREHCLQFVPTGYRLARPGKLRRIEALSTVTKGE